MTATSLLVVPRSMPMIVGESISLAPVFRDSSSHWLSSRSVR